jgi:hypothetical protein
VSSSGTLRSVFVTARTDEQQQLIGDIAEAATALDIDAHVDGEALLVDGNRILPQIVRRAHPTPADLSQLVAAAPGKLPAMVVADRISDAGREVLRRAGWGWLDRRGHLRLWASGVRIESALPATAATAGRSGVVNAWTTVGMEIALAALCDPEAPVTARRVAAVIGRSVGATHELIGRFVELGLVGRQTHRALLPDLFWEASARWPDGGWVGLPVDLADVAERIGGGELVRVDVRAATLGGARIAAVGDLPARCYVRSASALRRARALGERGPNDPELPVRCWVRASPVTWLPLNEDHPPDAAHPWSIGHPQLCALRLAADPSRGREIVEAWGIVPGAD